LICLARAELYFLAFVVPGEKKIWRTMIRESYIRTQNNLRNLDEIAQNVSLTTDFSLAGQNMVTLQKLQKKKNRNFLG
jgi:hypothetical protein